MNHKHTNALIHSTSPYLLQHAHNPVNWQQWNDQLVKEKGENKKLLLISIGYAACHWCHVMEHESFEDEEVAKIMNDNFTCIKIDREERPDVDHYYMSAIHLMGLQGGWPLNIIALPDGRPLWGGTYFPKKTWMENLTAVASFWKENKEKTLEYVENLQSGIEQTLLAVNPEKEIPVNRELVEKSVIGWKTRFDFENGGRKGYPKFPMPVNLDFLLYYGSIKQDVQVLDFVRLTLQKMAFGGIYDHIGGGFARYSTDEKWKIPHFEKMLYDNAQLIGTYSRGYQQYKLNDFREVVYETTQFIERELMSKEGAFYSSLDADSEGEEGKYYVWTINELKEALGEDMELFSSYYNVNDKGFWEKGNYILLKDMADADFAARNNLSTKELHEQVQSWKKLLLQKRSNRIPPALDDKTLCSWNALVIEGLTDAYKAFGDDYFKELALKNAHFIAKKMMSPGGKLFHSYKNGEVAVNGFMDDYALVMQAYISLFEITGDENWLQHTMQLLEFTFNQFYDEPSGLFLYAAKHPAPSISNHFQNEDNVIPAANSVMANNLHRLYLLYGNTGYLEKSKKMLQHTLPHFEKYSHAFANWGRLMLKLTESYYEVAITGENAGQRLMEMQDEFIPNVLWAIATEPGSIPLLKDRFSSGETLIYVCRNNSCHLPVKHAQDALEQIKKGG